MHESIESKILFTSNHPVMKVEKESKKANTGMSSAFDDKGGATMTPPSFQLKASSTNANLGDGKTVAQQYEVSAQIAKPAGEDAGQGAAGAVTRMRDIFFSSEDGFDQFDAVAGTVNYVGQVRNQGAAPGGFGVTRPSQAISDITITQTAATYNIRFTYTMSMDWTVRADTGPAGQINVINETSPAITAANYANVATALTPNMGDLNGRPPRAGFWNKPLTERHEQFHANEAVGLGRQSSAVAQTWLGTQTASSDAACQTLVTDAGQRIWQGMMAGMAEPAREERAYGDGAAAYLAMATEIRRKGAAGEYA
jgi:hypothetical protein